MGGELHDAPGELGRGRGLRDGAAPGRGAAARRRARRMGNLHPVVHPEPLSLAPRRSVVGLRLFDLASGAVARRAQRRGRGARRSPTTASGCPLSASSTRSGTGRWAAGPAARPSAAGSARARARPRAYRERRGRVSFEFPGAGGKNARAVGRGLAHPRSLGRQGRDVRRRALRRRGVRPQDGRRARALVHELARGLEPGGDPRVVPAAGFLLRRAVLEEPTENDGVELLSSFRAWAKSHSRRRTRPRACPTSCSALSRIWPCRAPAT